MSYDSYGQYGSDPRYSPYPQGPQYPQTPQYPPPPQYPQYPQSTPYPQSPPPESGPYAQPGGNDPTAPIVPSYGGNDPYGGADPYSGAGYGQDPYGGAAPSSGWPPPPGSVPPYGPPPRKSRTGLTIGLVTGGVVLVLCLGGLAVAGARLLADDPDPNDPIGLADPGSPADPADPGGDPFAGTPAADFAEGADGIQLPDAQVVGDFSAGEVEEMLGQVRDALIATRLAETMLLDHDPEPFIATMSPDNQEGLRKEFSEGTFGYFASQLADGAALAVPAPRVRGTVSFEATTDTSGFRVIEVVTSFVWAYAFVVPNDDPELDGIVVVHDELVWQVAHPADVADSSLGLWLWEGEAYASGIDCDAFDESLLAPQTEPQFGFGEGTDDREIYDPESSVDLPNTC
jgi:hypothetical protein